jgi:YidC/Oxa1 family membrane protein insertase
VSILNPLYDAIAWVIMRIQAVLAVPFGPASGLTWVLSIVLLVVFLRLLMLPLFIKQVHAQQRMQAHMPQLQELRKKYKSDKQKLNEETMKYYKENGVNPLSGCLPLLAQFPVFISLFSVLRAIADWTPGHPTSYGLTVSFVQDALKAKIFGVRLSDTFLHGTSPWSVKGVILVSVLISACTTYLTMRQSMKRGMMQQGPVDPDNPMAQSQKMMVYIAPLFALSGLYWAYGLVIYWVTNNLWTFGQQYFLFRNLPIVDSATVGGAVAPAGGSKPATQASRTTSAGKTPGKPASTAAGKTATASRGTTAGSRTTTSAKTGAVRPAAGQASKPAVQPAKAARPATPAQAASNAELVDDRDELVDDRDEPSRAKPGGATQKAGSAAGKQAPRPAKPAQAAPKATPAPTANGSSGTSASGSGLGRLFGKSKAEPEPVVPQKTTVRQQPVRQTRSKRSGKR